MIELIIIISLFCNGLYLVTSDGYVLYPVRKAVVWLLGGKINPPDAEKDYTFRSKIGEYLFTPILGCITCMASVWSVVIYSLFNDYTLSSIYTLPVIIFCCAGLNTIIYRTFLEEKKW